MLNRWQATKWCNLRKECYHQLCASQWHNNVRRLRRRYIVWDSFSAGFATLHQRLSIVKHLRRFHRNIYNHLIVSDINRSAGVHAICHNECLGIWFYCFRTPVCEDRHFLLSISKFSMAFFGEMVSEIWWLGRWCFRKYLASLSN